MSKPQIRTLRMALELLGTVERLAVALDVEPADLARWLAEPDGIPFQVFLDALDVVAYGRRRVGSAAPLERWDVVARRKRVDQGD